MQYFSVNHSFFLFIPFWNEYCILIFGSIALSCNLKFTNKVFCNEYLWKENRGCLIGRRLQRSGVSHWYAACASSASGGSITAAYYALNKDDYEEFERGFIKSLSKT